MEFQILQAVHCMMLAPLQQYTNMDSSNTHKGQIEWSGVDNIPRQGIQVVAIFIVHILIDGASPPYCRYR